MSHNGSVHVFGLGVRLVTQVTLETNYLLQQMDQIFHCEADSEISEYLASIGCTEMRLTHLYQDGRRREEAYQEICDTIIDAARSGTKCAYLAPGNPAFLNTITFKLREASSKHGLPFFAYPGVSSLDTLLTDLFIPIESTGLQCFEATHFVRMKPVVDQRVPLVLFQPGVVEAYEVRRLTGVYMPGVKILQDILIELYGADQRWILLRSANSKDESPIISSGVLSELIDKADHLKLGTLIIPSSSEDFES